MGATRLVCLVLASVFVLYAKTEPNACTTKQSVDPNPMNNIQPYLANGKLTDAFLRPFKIQPGLSDMITIARKGAIDKNPMCNLISWEVILLATGFSKIHENICILSEITKMALDYEITGDKDSLKCALNLIPGMADSLTYRTIEALLKNRGCNGFKRPIEAPIPSCANKNCRKTEEWKTLYEIIAEYHKKFDIPIVEGTYGVLETMMSSDDKNLQGLAHYWLVVNIHAAWSMAFGIASEPILYQTVAKVVNFMELIAFPKNCSCRKLEKHLISTATVMGNSIKAEMDFIKKNQKLLP